jgi:hypothetical protein
MLIRSRRAFPASEEPALAVAAADEAKAQEIEGLRLPESASFAFGRCKSANSISRVFSGYSDRANASSRHASPAGTGGYRLHEPSDHQGGEGKIVVITGGSIGPGELMARHPAAECSTDWRGL